MYEKSISALFCHKNMKESPPKVEFPLKKKAVDFLWQPSYPKGPFPAEIAIL